MDRFPKTRRNNNKLKIFLLKYKIFRNRIGLLLSVLKKMKGTKDKLVRTFEDRRLSLTA